MRGDRVPGKLKGLARRIGPSAVAILALQVSIVRASPLLEYRFNETGDAAPSAGPDLTPLLFTNALGQSAELHGSPGSGVTGATDDRAFDNTASTGMGNAGVGGMGAHAADDDAIDGLLSFTLSGWFKSEDASLPGNARLFKNTTGHDTARQGFHLIGGNLAGEIRLATDATEKTIQSVAAPGTWIFLAATYDGTQTRGNYKLYQGFRNAAEAPSGNPAVVLVDSKTVNEGTSEQNVDVLQVGNEDGQGFDYNRPFDGWLDNLRIDGSTINNSGAMSLASLESRRLADVPEPSTISLLAAAAAFLRARRRSAAR